MGKFVISKRKNGEFQFNLTAPNGYVILTSEGYASKQACMNGIESVKKNATDSSRFDKKISVSNKHYFNLKAANAQIIGTSEMYETETARDNGILTVQKNAPEAVLDDQLS